jgi:hypothetical protein
MACSADEIREEVWGQLRDHIDDGSLEDANVLQWFLDPAVEFPNPTAATNLEPLLINTAGSWADRPDAVHADPEPVPRADFVRGHTDLATMENANEAARRAVNGILDATGSRAPRCGCGRCASRRCSRRCGSPTSCAGSCAARRRRRCASGRRAGSSRRARWRGRCSPSGGGR